MDHLVFRSEIERIVETADFPVLADYLADDAELKVTIAVRSPTDGEVRGKQAVIDYFMNVKDASAIQEHRFLESLGSHERFVVVCDDGFAIMKGGIRVRSECAFVFDVHDGLITRLLIHQDLSVVGPHAGNKVLDGEGDDGLRAPSQQLQATGRQPTSHRARDQDVRALQEAQVALS
jgi:ketosteroid isomerase-like protein